MNLKGWIIYDITVVEKSLYFTGMGYLSQMLKRTPAYGSYKKYMRKLVDPLYNRVGYKSDPNDQPLDVFLRKLAINWACSMGNEDCIEKAKGDFRVWMDMPEPDSEGSNP